MNHLKYKHSVNMCQNVYHSYDLESLNKEMQVLLDVKDDTQYVAIRGSDSLFDWFYTNLNFCLKYPYQNKQAGVHKGFYFAKDSIIDLIYKELKNIPYENIIFTGHSMGAAIAQIVALNWELDHLDKKVSCINYACPKIGNRQFRRLFQDNLVESITINNKYDPINLLVPNYINPSCKICIEEGSIIKPHSIETYCDLIYTECQFDI